MEQRISVVTLGVSDMSVARDFYEQGLGWKAAEPQDEAICFFQMGGLVLALYPRDGLAEDATVPACGEGFRGITLAHNVREKHEVAAILDLAQRAGGTIVKPAQDVFWGGHSGYFSDPDGHLWEVAWNPFFQINERGEIVLSE